MNRVKSVVLPLFALSHSATPLPFTATESQAVADIVGHNFFWHISSDTGAIRTITCPVGVACQITVDSLGADSFSDLVSVTGVFGGQRYGFAGRAEPIVIGEFFITATATFGSGVTVGQTFTLPTDFFATIHTVGLDLRFQGSGSSQFVVLAAPSGVPTAGPNQVILDLGGASVFSGSGEQVPEQAQIPEPAAWQLAGIGLLFPLARRMRSTRQSS